MNLELLGTPTLDKEFIIFHVYHFCFLHINLAADILLLRCQGSSMVRFLRIDPMVSGSSPTSAEPSLRGRRVASSL